MSILTDPLPKTLEISGKIYPIASDFRTWILITELIEDPELTDAEKLDTTAVLVFDDYPFGSWEEWVEAYQQILWFYRCGREPQDDGSQDGGSSADAFSFEYDADYICPRITST